MFFLLTIPFVLIVGLVWITGIVGFSPWIIAGVVLAGGFFCWRLYRRWQKIKAKMAAHSSEFRDFVQEAAKAGKDIQVDLLNGLVTFRYQGQQPFRQLPAPRLALAGPDLDLVKAVAAVPFDETYTDPNRLRQDLEEFARLRDAGVLSAEEFEAIKTRLLERFTMTAAAPAASLLRAD